MFYKTNVLCLTAVAVLTAAGPANAGQIYLDDFSGLATTDLHGTTPDVTTGGETWVATSVYKADGSFTLDAPTTMTLAFTPVDGRVYTLDAQIEDLGGNHWAQFGFGDGQPTDAIWTTRAWHLMRVASGVSSQHYTALNGTAGLAVWSSLSTLDYANDIDVRIVLDTTGGTNNWTATYYAKAGNVGTYTEVRSATTLDENITSVGFSTFNAANSGKLNSFSLSDDTGGASFALTITPNATTSGNYDFEWDSQDGKVYDLVSATDLSTAPDTWPVYLGNENIAGAAPTNTLMDVAGGGGPARFFAMIEKDPPPLFSEDFESDNGGFTVATTSGTDWAHGDPDSTGLGGSVTEGNGGSTNCWGTGIGNPGFYADPTDTCLRSAVIDLTGVTAAELTFAQALDLEGSDSVTVNIIDDTTDTVIAADIVSITDTDDSSADWESIGPVTIPGGALGQEVRIEWCLNGVGGTTDDYMGWYIDDVTVTETTP